MIEWILEWSSATWVGLLALTWVNLSLALASDRSFLALLSTGVGIWAAHYWLLGETVAMGFHVVGATSIMVAHFMRLGSFRANLMAACVVMLVNLTINVVFWAGAWDVIALTATACLTFSQYLQSGPGLRLGQSLGNFLYFVFAIGVGSVPHALATGSAGLASLVGFFRYKGDK